ncbi:MAG: ADP-forming succinate--CoA ligase subunit beta [Gammaproteobacteria bacterium]|nr:ADP-forming succinate--CoA ligase subunit beta [Gammaproteobacteria bacterium]MCI0590635.1 ADP-forming succinate--CoA ligase subunit beta [Gammaproteobacteria bacterium]
MKLHEYQSKQLFREYGIPVPLGKPARSIREALHYAKEVEGQGWVVKAQVHAGGRGKAGGIKVTRSLEELEDIVRGMLGTRLITNQSGASGQPVSCVLVEAITPSVCELYLGLVIDGACRRIAVIASTAGGVDIEEVAARQPDKIYTVTVDPTLGLKGFHCRRVGFSLGLDEKQRKQLSQIMDALYRLFIDKDLTQIEINPLIVTEGGDLEALDAKIKIDDNALFRQPDLAQWRDPTQEDPKESAAKRFDLNYVALDGDIACMVNGAGLAMATMDIIKLHGGEPANFLDVGGNTTTEKVSEAFKLIVSDRQVRAILVNIFGGIVRCDLVAEGIIKAVQQVGVGVPVVVRLEGTSVELGREFLTQSGLPIITAHDLAEAAQKVVDAARASR